MPQLPALTVLFEDNHLLAVDKPAGLPTMGVAEGKPSLLTAAKQYLRVKYNKPGNVYLGTVSRLDAPVTGVVLFARTSKAAGRLSEQFRRRQVEKFYWAICRGRIQPPEDELVHWLRKDERHRRMHICQAGDAGAQQARLTYRLLKRQGEHSVLEVQLETGRKHQIRVQLAHRGYPIIGDRKYGSRQTFAPGIGLHARRLVFEHPVRQHEVEIQCPLPASWGKLGAGLDE